MIKLDRSIIRNKMSAESINPRKQNRIDLRLSTEHKDLLETAAAIKGLSLSSYILSQCLVAAKLDLANHQKLVLSDRDRDLFLDLMKNPPNPNAALKSALQDFQENFGE